MDGDVEIGTKVTFSGSEREQTQPRADLVIREGRGRLGGTLFLDLLIQRAREHGRRVQPLDGDLKSRTLSTLYPARDAKGKPIKDGASSPASDGIIHQKEWIQSELNSMTEDRVSRVLDLSGGDRVMQELVMDLMLKSFCAEFQIGLTNVVMLGPDLEDFNHAMERVHSQASVDRVLMVLNEGVIRQGQTAEGAFDGVLKHPDFQATLHAGAQYILLRRLSCMHVLRERGIGFYDAAFGRPDRTGAKVPPTVQHMTKLWLTAFEKTVEDIADWLP